MNHDSPDDRVGPVPTYNVPTERKAEFFYYGVIGTLFAGAEEQNNF